MIHAVSISFCGAVSLPGARSHRAPRRRLDGDELKAQLLGSLDEPEQMRLVDHAAGQHRRARHPVHLHPLEQEAERLARLAAKSQPVPPAMCPIAVHQRTLTLRQVTCHHLLIVST